MCSELNAKIPVDQLALLALGHNYHNHTVHCTFNYSKQKIFYFLYFPLFFNKFTRIKDQLGTCPDTEPYKYNDTFE
jgi:hypothetical protein